MHEDWRMSVTPPPPDNSGYPGYPENPRDPRAPGSDPTSNYPGSGQPPFHQPNPQQPNPQPTYGWWAYGPMPPTPGYAPGMAYYSNKTKAAAGLLQLLPGFFLSIGGIGRCYTGHAAAGVIHIVLSVLGWMLSPIYIGIPLVIGCWLWAVIDGIVLLAGRPTDAQKRLLR